MIFVNAHAFAAQAVDNLVLAVECGSSQAANEERNGNGIGACRRGHSVAGNRKLVIADGVRGAASAITSLRFPRTHKAICCVLAIAKRSWPRGSSVGLIMSS